MHTNIRFTEANWAQHAQNWGAWWAGELDRPLVMIETRPPAAADEDYQPFVSNYPLAMPVDAVLDSIQRRLEATRYHGDAWPKWWVNFGPGIMAGFLGAEVRPAPDTVWFLPAEHKPLADRHLRWDEANTWWQRILALTEGAVERWGGEVSVGLTDLGGNLDILVSLHGAEPLFYDLYAAPQEVLRLAGEITDLWLHGYDRLAQVICAAGRGTTPWAAIWSPGRCYMLQCDFSFILSPAMFEQFVLPDLAACCAALDHAFYHLDGPGEVPHLDLLLALEDLHGIQWIPGLGAPPPEQWLSLLKRIRDGGKLCQLYVSPGGAQTIVRELGGRGFAFCIEEAMTPEAADDLVRVLTA